MKYIRLDLLTLLISLFILNSCKSPDGIGLEVDPANQIETRLVDTSTIQTVTVKEDTVISSGISQHPFGYLQDPDIGNTRADLAMGLTLPSPSLTFGTAPVLDSAVLVLKYGDEFFGDSTSSQYTVNVHQLSEKLSSSVNYYNNKSWNYNQNTIIGTTTLTKFAVHDSVFINQVLKSKTDVQKFTAPHIRIPLSSSFINSAFLKADPANFVSSAIFNNYIKGLYLTVKTRAADKGGIVLFDLATADSSRLEIYYKNTSGTTIDTNVTKFSVTTYAAAANITHTYTTAVQTQLNNPGQQFNMVYAQPLAGLRAKINFPNIKKLKELGNITINKAELVVQIQGGTDSPLNPAPRLTFYRTDIAAQRQPVPDNNFGQKGTGDARALQDGAFGGFYDKTNKRYTFILTSYIQDILSGKLTQYDAYIAPLKNNLVRQTGDPSDLLPSATTAARSLLGGSNKLPSSTVYKMKLNIIYTRLK